MSNTSSQYRPDIDGLRAVAILFVLGFHAFPNFFKGGFVGVDVFFVISGFLISGIILKALEKKTFTYADFYSRRIKRIFPALLVVLTVFMIFGWWALFSDEYASLGKHVASGAGFISNITLWYEVGYFDIASELKPMLHLWSLGIEEQFYILWPALLVFFYKRTRRLFMTICLLSLASFLIYVGGRQIGINSVDAFYFPITRFWELLLGSSLAYLAIYHRGLVAAVSDKLGWVQNQKLISEILSYLGLVLLVISIIILSKDNSLHRLGLLLPALGSFFLISSGSQTWVNRNILACRPMVFVGLISYPLYLWHWPLLSFARRIESGTPSIKLRLMMLVASIILAWLTYQFIEKPVRFSTYRFMPIMLCLVMLLVGLTGLTIYLKDGFNFRYPVQEKLIQSMERGEIIEDEVCKKIYEADIGNNYCRMVGSSKKHIFVVGDSHSQAIYESYSPGLESSHTVINLGNSSCPFLIPEDSLKNNSIKPEELSRLKACNVKIEKIIDRAIAERVEGVILANNGWDNQKVFLEAGMIETLSRFPASMKVIWFTQNPKVPFDLRLCINRPLLSSYHSGDCSFPRSVFDEWTKGYAEIISNIVKKYPKLIVIDPSLAICDSSKCQVVLNDQFLYNDTTHFSLIGGRYLADKLPIKQFFSK